MNKSQLKAIIDILKSKECRENFKAVQFQSIGDKTYLVATDSFMAIALLMGTPDLVGQGLSLEALEEIHYFTKKDVDHNMIMAKATKNTLPELARFFTGLELRPVDKIALSPNRLLQITKALGNDVASLELTGKLSAIKVMSRSGDLAILLPCRTYE